MQILLVTKDSLAPSNQALREATFAFQEMQDGTWTMFKNRYDGICGRMGNLTQVVQAIEEFIAVTRKES